MNKSLVLCYAFNPITKCEVIKEYYSQFLYSRGNSTLPGETGETSQKNGCAMDVGFPSQQLQRAAYVQQAAYKEVGPAADSRNLRIEGEFVL